MPQGNSISFVTWPNGEVDEHSVTVGGERIARQRFVDSYLPEQWFGNHAREYVADTLWKGAREKGFRSYTITIGADGEPKLDK
jgi:hypothetical protein